MTHDEYLQLCGYLNTLCIAYYEEGISLIEDYDYDKLLKKLAEYEAKYPDRIAADTPTRRVGGIKKDVPTVTHLKPMLSIQNCLDTDSLTKWLESIKEKVGKVSYVLEPKYDGLAGDVCYIAVKDSDAVAVQASTRGDGITGENITRNFFLTSIVRNIPSEVDVNVRGEIMLSLSGFAAINDSLPPTEESYANPRNAISGLMRRKQLDASIAKHILFFPYEIVAPQYEGLNRTDKISLLQEWFNQPITSFLCSDNPDEIIKTIEALAAEFQTMDIECDGVVIKVNEAGKCSALGIRTNSPRWAVAYKFPPKKASTLILSIRWQVGRTGEVAPVADVAPVPLGGVIVTKALMHNLGKISDYDWRVGDTVEIWRGGEVIPRLGAVDISKRPSDAIITEEPALCPCCHKSLSKVGVKLFCRNTYGCADQLKYTYDYIFSRKVFDVEGISDKTIEQIVEKLSVKCSADFFKLTKEDFLKLEGFKDKSAVSLEEALSKASKQPLHKVLCALCIPGVAQRTCRSIANYLINNGKNIHDFFTLRKEELTSIEDIGDLTAEAIEQSINDNSWLKNAKALIECLHITYDDPVQSIYRENITGKRFCITGRFPDSREHMSATLRLHGALVTGAVSSKTDYLLVGESPSTGDIDKANKHSVTILNFDQYQALFLN